MIGMVSEKDRKKSSIPSKMVLRHIHDKNVAHSSVESLSKAVGLGTVRNGGLGDDGT